MLTSICNDLSTLLDLLFLASFVHLGRCWSGYMVVGVVIWLLEWLYGCWSGYMVVGAVIWLLERLHGCWSGYMVVGAVTWLLG